MKKNKQMKPDNVAKRLWAFFIVLTMCITVQPVVPVKAQEAVQTAARTIYTEFKDGNSTHSGDGSYGNPYNLIEDAYAAAGNGDEISILGSGAFLNAEAAEPFIFDKSVTVNGNGNTFSNRKGGFILNTDVTFKNITLRFSNRLHDAISVSYTHLKEDYNFSRCGCKISQRGRNQRHYDYPDNEERFRQRDEQRICQCEGSAGRQKADTCKS